MNYELIIAYLARNFIHNTKIYEKKINNVIEKYIQGKKRNVRPIKFKMHISKNNKSEMFWEMWKLYHLDKEMRENDWDVKQVSFIKKYKNGIKKDSIYSFYKKNYYYLNDFFTYLFDDNLKKYDHYYFTVNKESGYMRGGGGYYHEISIEMNTDYGEMIIEFLNVYMD